MHDSTKSNSPQTAESRNVPGGNAAERNSPAVRPQGQGPGSSLPDRRDNRHSAVGLSGSSGGAQDNQGADRDQSLTIIAQQVALLDWSLREDWRPTEDQAKVLGQEIDPEWVEVKYPNVPYLPGAWYRKVFDEAFGIAGWQLIEVGPPHKALDGYYQSFVFKVGKVPIKKVAGYMSNQGENKVLTPGVALEGMRTNAIMRVAKDLGVARNLWLPAWCRKWLRDYCEIVGTTPKKISIWARKDDEHGFDALAFDLDEQKMAAEAAAYDPDNMAHLEAIARLPKIKSADKHARNAAKAEQLKADLEQHLRDLHIDDGVEAEHDGWEEGE